MSEFILVTGGARSGKSSFAELIAKNANLPVTYIATAQVKDEEMAERVNKHRQQRPGHWKLVEEPFQVKKVLEELNQDQGVILLDCVTLWLSNLLFEAEELNPLECESKILYEVQAVAHLAQEIVPTVILVTNEVGQGIVPENHLARAYRDIAGRANQILAKAAQEVYMVIAGYPVEIKQPGQTILDRLASR